MLIQTPRWNRFSPFFARSQSKLFFLLLAINSVTPRVENPIAAFLSWVHFFREDSRFFFLDLISTKMRFGNRFDEAEIFTCKLLTMFRDRPRYKQARVAGWYIFRPKLAIWVNFGGPCKGRCWYILWTFGLFYSHLIFVFYGLLVYFVVFNLFGILKKNLATLKQERDVLLTNMQLVLEHRSARFTNAKFSSNGSKDSSWLQSGNEDFHLVEILFPISRLFPDYRTRKLWIAERKKNE
jgi:hypothetical protein